MFRVAGRPARLPVSSIRIQSGVCRLNQHRSLHLVLPVKLVSSSRVVESFGPHAFGPSFSNSECLRRFSTDSGVVVVPSLGDSITEGTVTDIMIKVGDLVQAEDVVASIETDKVSVDIRSPFGGTVTEVLVSVGDDVPVGASLMNIAVGATGGATPTAPAKSAPVKSAPAKSMPKPPTVEPPSMPKAPPRPTESVATVSVGLRVPSIKFRHGRLNANRVTSLSSPAKSTAAEPTVPQPQATHVTILESSAPLQSRTLSEREIAFINFGGAEPY
eukprot:gb/GEZN01009752.1/.p2 GENE.gb/GEZN01009752.1/~~gb/GEZN01009752.1/.p2  ORF type:complete len:273 (-),score=18.22 gb/GEZN01009752.1/:345-1163(-)